MAKLQNARQRVISLKMLGIRSGDGKKKGSYDQTKTHLFVGPQNQKR